MTGIPIHMLHPSDFLLLVAQLKALYLPTLVRKMELECNEMINYRLTTQLLVRPLLALETFVSNVCANFFATPMKSVFLNWLCV